MNFVSKKLKNQYSNVSELSDRERKLLAENKKLKRKNKRLSTAMLYLVDQIETRLPLFTAQKPPKVLPKKEPDPIPSPAKTRLKRNVSSITWTPEKLDDSQRPQRRRTPLSMQQIFASKNSEKSLTPPERADDRKTAESPLAKKTPLAEKQASLAAKLKPEVPAETIQTPDLAPEEMSLLASPTKERPKDLTKIQPTEVFVKLEQKTVSALEASQSYRAVSIASAPVPDVKTAEDEEDEAEKKLLRQNNMMREAMLRRVNRLRW
ncbi:hypothetical protein [Sneathiella aquimaris]|uniref:hypothetical protein n=1 Tax=Sneathiella aquimaris TaxID=2599305 RepID=UPI00146C15BE|nr:hypothetical protein [Sneathiella aquimaris]